MKKLIVKNAAKILRKASISLGLMAVALTVNAQNHVDESEAIIRYDSIHHPVIGTKGMVSSQRKLASQIGAEILSRGGNAVDVASYIQEHISVGGFRGHLAVINRNCFVVLGDVN